MNIIRIWKGAKRYENGRDLSNFAYVEFEGGELGSVSYGDEERGVVYSFYLAADGRAVVHETVWSAQEDEDDIGNVHVFASVDDAAAHYRRHMERAGIIERRVLTLDDLEV